MSTHRPTGIHPRRGASRFQELSRAIATCGVIILPPLLFAIFLDLRRYSAQPILLSMLAGSVLLTWALRQSNFISVDWSRLLLWCCALLVSALVWNHLFTLYITTTHYRSDIFRDILQTPHAPIYGITRAPNIKGTLYLLLSAGIYVGYLIVKRSQAIEVSNTTVAVGFMILFSVRFILAGGVTRLAGWVGHYNAFAEDLPRFSGVANLLQNYTGQMSGLSVHGNHYPPGILLMMAVARLLNLPQLPRLIVSLSGIATLWMLNQTARIVHLPVTCGRLAVFLFILSPAVLVYITTDPAFIVVFLSTATVYLFLQAMVTSRAVVAVAFGLTLALDTLFSFSSVFLALLLGIVLLLFWKSGIVRLSQWLPQVALSTATFLVVYIILYKSTGFNLADCVREAMVNNKRQMSSGFDSVPRYLLRSTAALLAYMIAAGFVQSYLAVRAFLTAFRGRTSADIIGTMAKGLIVTVLISGFSGAFFLETERIWLFFTPVLVLVAASAANRVYSSHGFTDVGAMLSCSALSALVYQTYLQSVF